MKDTEVSYSVCICDKDGNILLDKSFGNDFKSAVSAMDKVSNVVGNGGIVRVLMSKSIVCVV